ncbi:Ribosomal RNA small subunit methyltransferase [Trichinella spiralis]|uniref:Ribosomal RNA small subunit methyltransferase n=1 Tax=Trichinella spiralis TaxID=6334 RepID=A0ABR3L2I4_TRISP|nr:conserved hypothetical protein [Trichinella spiralis]
MNFTTDKWTKGKLNDPIERDVDALTTMGKNHRNIEILAVELLVIDVSKKLTAVNRLEWDTLVKTDEKLRSNLTAFQRFRVAHAESRSILFAVVLSAFVQRRRTVYQTRSYE